MAGRPWFNLLLFTVNVLFLFIYSGQWWWGQRWWWRCWWGHLRKASHEERVFSPQPVTSGRGQWTWNDRRGEGVPVGVCIYNSLSIFITCCLYSLFFWSTIHSLIHFWYFFRWSSQKPCSLRSFWRLQTKRSYMWPKRCIGKPLEVWSWLFWIIHHPLIQSHYYLQYCLLI